MFEKNVTAADDFVILNCVVPFYLFFKGTIRHIQKCDSCDS